VEFAARIETHAEQGDGGFGSSLSESRVLQNPSELRKASNTQSPISNLEHPFFNILLDMH
jgi:hypothetical protein